MIDNEISMYEHIKTHNFTKSWGEITKGETIGTMSFTENENLVEVILYESTNGKNCETKNINKKTVDPSLYLEYQEVPEPDYLHYPMAASQSCTNIILEFRRIFQNIKLNIFSGQ